MSFQMTKNLKRREYAIVAYGSLMSHQSIRETIPDRHFTPVIVKGYQRIFDLAVERGKCPDVLNVVKASGHSFNGLLFKVTNTELRKIKEREDDYNLVYTWAYEFLTGQRLCRCLVSTDVIVALDQRSRKPNKSYFIMCREAAYHVSPEFGVYWDMTTYTVRGQTITDWIKKNKTYNTLT
jgi:cation transport regulator ChaC